MSRVEFLASLLSFFLQELLRELFCLNVDSEDPVGSLDLQHLSLNEV
jgi:hypothetical protein